MSTPRDRLAGLVPRRARRLSVLAAARLRVGPSVVRLVVGAERADPEALDAVLHRLRAVGRGSLQVLVVGAGDPDRDSAVGPVAARHAAEDWRVTVEPRPEGHRVDVRPGEQPDPRTLARLLGQDAGDVADALLDVPAARDEARFGQVDNPLPELPGWLEGIEAGLSALTAEPGPRRAWAGMVLRHQAPRFLVAAERMDDGAWSALQACVARLGGQLDPAGWAALAWLTRSMTWLASEDRRAGLEDLVAGTRFDDGQVPTTVEDRIVRVAERPGGPSLTGLPDRCLELHADETPLRASLRRAWWSDDTTLQLELFAYVTRVGTDGAGVVAQAWLESDSGERLPLDASVSEDGEVTRWARERFQGHDRGVLRVPVDVRRVAGSPHAGWRLRLSLETQALSRSGEVLHADRTGSFGFLEPRRMGDRVVRLVHRDDGLALRLEPEDLKESPSPAGPEITGVRAADGRLLLEGRGFANLTGTRFTLVGPGASLVGETQDTGEGSVEIAFPTRADEWGRGVAAVRSGGYRLVVERDGRTVGAAPARTLADRLPLQLRTHDHRIRVRGGRDGLVVALDAPLLDDERGPRAQQLLQERYATQPDALDPGLVYLQAYTGQSATDSPLAIHAELRRRRPDLRLVWAVADRSSWVPDGAETVLWRSRAWYDVVGRAALVVTNIELEPWFHPRAGQTVVQTFHGYPSKSMGIRLWRSKDFTDSRIEQQLARTSAKWTVLLTPSPEMDVHYREEYRYDGDILASGYPRDDALLAPDADEVRDRVRRRMGAEPDQVVVLYAPTWRDDLATNFRAARMADHLDTDAAAKALGPDYLILLRGHRFHARAREGHGRSGARVLDVTDYPEINDLVLACDVAVLDYSSLRFDVAVTGKPMVFLVPDLDDYASSTRGFLFDFRESAPGPLLSTTGEVVAALQDLDRVRAEHREHYERFNERFNRLQDGRAAERVVDRLLG